MTVLAAAAALLLVQAAASVASAGPPDNTVRAVEIVREDVFDATETGLLARLGNALHARTHDAVVARELLVRPGAPLDSARLAESLRNLRDLRVFRRVLVDTVASDSGLVVRVTTKDGWSTWPDAEISSAGGETAYSVGLVEYNLLGTAAYAELRYRRDRDRDAAYARFAQPRAFGGRASVGLAWEDRSDGRYLAASVGRPFFTLSTRTGGSLSLSDFDGDVLRYVNGVRDSSATVRRRYTWARAEVAHALRASPAGYLRVGLVGRVRRDDSALLDAGGTAALPHTVAGDAGVWVEWMRARYRVLRNFRSFLREEDVDLGTAVRLGVVASPAALGWERSGAGLELSARTALALPAGFLAVRGSAGGRWDGAGLDSGTVRLAGTFVVQPGTRHTVHAYGTVAAQRDPAPGEELDLGLRAGLRAFGAHAFTGDRSAFAAAEYRWTATDDLLGLVGVGLAAFAERGGAWYAGSPQRWGTDAGVGLRLGSTRTATANVGRVDLARRFATDRQPAAWVMVVGTGMAF